MGEDASIGESTVEIRAGAARAELVPWDYCELYEDMALRVEDECGVVAEDVVWLEGLTNGGSKGDGARVLLEAAARARAAGWTMLVLALSAGGDQARLSAWYARHLDRVPTRGGRRLENVFSSPKLTAVDS